MRRIIAMAALAAVMAAAGAQAAEHEVHMLNRGEKGTMVFEPDIIYAAPGDTIRFIPTDKTHNAETIPGMWPGDADTFKGKINEDITFTVTEEGVYGIKCLPHYAMGMVGLVVVGEPANLEEARAVRHPGVARKRFEEIFAAVPTN